MSNERIQTILLLMEFMKEPMDKLNIELNKLLNEDIPEKSYIVETPEFEKVVNYYLGLPNSSSLEDFSNAVKELEKTLKQYHIGMN